MAGTAQTGAASPTHQAHRPMLGILFMMAATTAFPFMGALVQLLSDRYGWDQIVWARVTGQLAFVLALFWPSRRAAIFITRQPLSQAARSFNQLASTSLYFASVKFMHLAQATAISFTTPFIVAVLAAPILGERITRARLVTLIVGFVGVLVIIRPASDVFQWASVGIILSATFYALYQVYTRRVSSNDPPDTSTLYSVLLGAIVMSVVMLFRWKTPGSWLDVLMLAGTGLFGGLGHYCLARAFAYAPASVVSPFMYWQLIGATVLGYFISGKLPDVYTFLGAAILVGAGMHMGWRETREKQR